MRLATFTDESSKPRFGIVRGESVVEVVAAANALHRAVPAATVKIALTSGAHTIAALEELAGLAERAGLLRPVAGLKFLPPIPDLQNSSVSARTTGSIARNWPPTRC